MGAIDAVITTVVISIAALVGIAVMDAFLSTYSLPDGPLRPGAVAFLDAWSTALVLGVTLLSGFSFLIIAMLASLR